MKRLWLCLLVVTACETQAAPPASGFQSIYDLDGAAAASVTAVLADLPVEDLDRLRVDYLPRSLDDAQRLIQTWHGEEIDAFEEACDTAGWLLLSQVPASEEGRFKRGWAIERASLQIYEYDLKR